MGLYPDKQLGLIAFFCFFITSLFILFLRLDCSLKSHPDFALSFCLNFSSPTALHAHIQTYRSWMLLGISLSDGGRLLLDSLDNVRQISLVLNIIKQRYNQPYSIFSCFHHQIKKRKYTCTILMHNMSHSFHSLFTLTRFGNLSENRPKNLEIWKSKWARFPSPLNAEVYCCSRQPCPWARNSTW